MFERGYLRVIAGRQGAGSDTGPGAGSGVGPIAGALRAGLAALTPLYRAELARRNRRFDRGVGVTTLERPVISVGNLTTGGTGKTPVVAWVCEQLLSRGQRPCILMRGYKSEADSESSSASTSHSNSDEALEYEHRFADRVPVYANPDRIASAHRALDEDPSLTHFVLDDGFQHRKIARAIDLVLIDATAPFGPSASSRAPTGHCLPRGLMREPITALKRARAVVITRCDLVASEALLELKAQLERHHGRPIAADTRHAWTEALDDRPGLLTLEQFQALAKAPGDGQVTVALGIGNPGAVTRAIEGFGLAIAHLDQRSDHHHWTAADARALMAPGHPLVTTLKDWVKLRAHVPEDFPVCVPIVGIEIMSGAIPLEV